MSVQTTSYKYLLNTYGDQGYGRVGEDDRREKIATPGDHSHYRGDSVSQKVTA